MRRSRSARSITAWTIAVILTFGILPSFAYSQSCGNFNCMGIIDLGDFSAAVNYLTGGGYTPSCLSTSDMDGHYLYTWYDLALLTDYLGHGFHGTCPPTLPALNPDLSPGDYVVTNWSKFPADSSHLALKIRLTVADSSDWFCVPVRILVDGVVPTIDSARDGFIHAQLPGDGVVYFLTGGSTSTKIPSATRPGYSQVLATLFLSMPVSSSDRPITLSYEPQGPTQDGYEVNIPMVIRIWPGRGAVTPTLPSSCCQGKTGDINGSGLADLTDLSMLVLYLTGGGISSDVYFCYDAANIDASGLISLPDLTGLVSYLTGGGYVLPSCSI